MERGLSTCPSCRATDGSPWSGASVSLVGQTGHGPTRLFHLQPAFLLPPVPAALPTFVSAPPMTALLLLWPPLRAGSVPHWLFSLVLVLLWPTSSRLQSGSQSFESSAALALFSIGLVNIQPKLFPQTLSEVLARMIWYNGRWGHSGWR